MAKKTLIRITESDIKRVVLETARRIIKESKGIRSVHMDIDIPEELDENGYLEDVELECTYEEYMPGSFNINVTVPEQGLSPEVVEYIENVWADEHMDEIEQSIVDAGKEDEDDLNWDF